MSGGNPTSARNYRYPFTATQWQELEHQALIFKYMVSGVPIPTDLVYSFKRRLDSSSISSRLFPHNPCMYLVFVSIYLSFVLFNLLIKKEVADEFFGGD